MGHRHTSNSFNMPEMDQVVNQNHSTSERSYIHMGRAVAPQAGSLVNPVDNMLMDEVHYTSSWNSDSRGNEHSSSNISRGVSQFQPAFPDPFHNSFPCLPAAGNFNRAPENNAGHAHSSCNNRHSINEIEGKLQYPVPAPDRGSTSRSYGVESSFSSTGLLQEIPTLNYPHTGSISLFQNRGISPSVAGEDSLRNVRRRISLDLEANPVRSHVSGYSSDLNHSTTHLTNYSGVDLMTMNSGELPQYRGISPSVAGEDSSRNVRRGIRFDMEAIPVRSHVSGHSSHHNHSTTHLTKFPGAGLTNTNSGERTCEWNFIPLGPAAHGRILRSESRGFSHATNQFPVGGSNAETSHNNSVSGVNPVILSYPHRLPLPSAWQYQTYYPQRATPLYQAGPSHFRLAHETAFSGDSLQSLSEVYPIQSWPSFARGWHNSYGNGSSRIVSERFQLISSALDAYGRMGPEAFMMGDHSPFNAGSVDLFDPYRDMRLDIDNLSFEDLLALGERIGAVNTGLSEDMISKCLTKIPYNSSDDKSSEGTCVICFEEYKKEEAVGVIKKCGHNYHVGCITKWLLMKNVCPVCKAPALADFANGK